MGEKIIKLNLDSLPEVSKGSGLWAMMDETGYSNNNFPIEELQKTRRKLMFGDWDHTGIDPYSGRPLTPEKYDNPKDNIVTMEDLLNSTIIKSQLNPS